MILIIYWFYNYKLISGELGYNVDKHQEKGQPKNQSSKTLYLIIISSYQSLLKIPSSSQKGITTVCCLAMRYNFNQSYMPFCLSKCQFFQKQLLVHHVKSQTQVQKGSKYTHFLTQSFGNIQYKAKYCIHCRMVLNPNCFLLRI